MVERKNIRLLILEDSQNEAERLVSLFRNAGHATRVHRLTSGEDLIETLQQTWDLLIAAPQSESLSSEDALTVIQRQAKDIPIIQLVDGNSSELITDVLESGVQDAVPQGEDKRLILVAERELANLEERRARRETEIALREAEKRCQLLLSSSINAITYMHDGMHIYTNHAYLELFGYEDSEELEGMPMIDLISTDCQDKFKQFLKQYQRGDASNELPFTGLRADGTTFEAQMVLSPATYDGEPCTQVVIQAQTSNAELEEKLREISSQDPVTGLYNRTHFLELMDAGAERAIKTGQPSTLAYILVDRYDQLLGEVGLANISSLLIDLANLLRSHFPEDTILARCGDDVFTVLLPGQTPQQSRPSFEQLLKTVENHLFDVGGRTIQTTLSIGMAGFNEKTSRAQTVIDRAHRCADDVNETGNALKIFDPSEELAAAASRGNLEAMVKHGLEHNGFTLLFQPIISLHGDRYEYYEVTLKLISPQAAEIPATDFMNAALEAGLQEKVDRWVILNAIKLLAEHRSKGHDTRLFIHLSAMSIQDQTLLPWLSVALKAAQLPPDSLIFQIGEPDAITYLKQVRLLAQKLRELHCKMALGQFGCALNPFNTLKYLPTDFVKIDGSFVEDLNTPENLEELKTMLTSLQTQGKLTMVPRVQSAAELAVLWQTGVSYIQGPYLQVPGPEMNYDFSSGDE